MSQLFRKRLIAIKRETTYGTDSLTLATQAANAVLVRNLSITPVDIQYASRELVRPYLGNFDDIPTAASVRVSFEVEAQGSGVAGTRPAYGDLLMACGFSETINMGTSVAYNPVSEMFSSVSIYFNIDGNLHRINGARGTVSYELMAKEIPVFRFEFVGLKGAIGRSLLPLVNYSTYIEPLPVNPLNTTSGPLQGYQPIVGMFSFDMANELSFRTLIGAETVEIVDRKPAGKISIESPEVDMKNFFEAAEDGIAGAYTITHGKGAGKRIVFSAPNLNIKNPNYTEQDGIAMVEMDLQFLPNRTAQGNDEVRFVFN